MINMKNIPDAAVGMRGRKVVLKFYDESAGLLIKIFEIPDWDLSASGEAVRASFA